MQSNDGRPVRLEFGSHLGDGHPVQNIEIGLEGYRFGHDHGDAGVGRRPHLSDLAALSIGRQFGRHQRLQLRAEGIAQQKAALGPHALELRAGQAAMHRPRIKAPRQYDVAGADGDVALAPVGNAGRTAHHHNLHTCLPDHPETLFEIEVIERVLSQNLAIRGNPDHVAPVWRHQVDDQRRKPVRRVQPFPARNGPSLCYSPLEHAVHSISPERTSGERGEIGARPVVLYSRIDFRVHVAFQCAKGGIPAVNSNPRPASETDTSQSP